MSEQNELDINVIQLKQMVSRLQTVLRRTLRGEVLSICDRCDGSQESLTDCIKCCGTGWVTVIPNQAKQLAPREVPIDHEILSALEEALHKITPRHHLGTYGFLDIAVQPYDGMYSNPYPLGDPYEVRLIKSNYHEQNLRNAAAFASCEAAYLESPE